jgi:hypothetical protein
MFSPNDIPIILIDEFDKVDDLATPMLMANLIKYLSDYNVNVTLIVVGVGDNVSSLIGEHESIRRCISPISMPRMKPAELQEILDKRLPHLGMQISSDARSQIVTLARGLPAYVHALGRFAVQTSLDHKKLVVTTIEVDTATQIVLKQTDFACRDDYAKATRSNQKDALYEHVLLACALAGATNDGFFAPNAIVKPLTDILLRPVQIATFQRHLKEFASPYRGDILQQRGKPRAYRFRFKDPMMQPYIIMKGIVDGTIPKSARAILSFPEQPELSSEF